MSDAANCPTYKNVDGGTCRTVNDQRGIFSFECTICGKFRAGSPAVSWLKAARDESGEPKELREITRFQRALISYRIRNAERTGVPFRITMEWLTHLLSEGSLPSPIMQAENLIRYIGDEVRRSGSDLGLLPEYLHAVIGAPSREAAIKLAIELGERGFLRLNPGGAAGTIGRSKVPVSMPTEIGLSLDGWQRYEDEKIGRFAAKFGFIAMEFGNAGLESLVEEVIKPIIKNDIGYEVVDMRDIARAGIIDNIMRTQIRDCAFVIADLTHDNSGAYWEAGYAEGLGKPVVYICEKKKFNTRSTHFDTNHCTTVVWSKDDVERFGQELIATLRRSLDDR